MLKSAVTTYKTVANIQQQKEKRKTDQDINKKLCFSSITFNPL